MNKRFEYVKIHWSDYASHPEIRIACTQNGYHPWGADKDLPDDVYNADYESDPNLLYTFKEELVTCEECMKLESFQRELARVREYRREVAESGMSEHDYIEHLREKTLSMLKERKSRAKKP